MILNRKKFTVLTLKHKLISVFALVSLIPIISLLIISYIIIAKSIDRLENVSNELKKLRVLPMADITRSIAYDPKLIEALENKTDLSKIDFALPESYILAVYNLSGKVIYSSTGDPALYKLLESFDRLGLPPISDFPIEGIILPEETIRIDGDELAINTMMCRSLKDGNKLGILLIGKITPTIHANISNVRRTIVIILVLSSILVFIISLWISSLIAREITEPIQKLVNGTREVAQGNLDYQVNISASDEVGILSESFNQMTKRLKQYAEELKQAEKSSAWKEVAQKLAHEIKNPLTPIQLSAERLKRRYYINREGYEQILEECTNVIIDEVERLRRLLDEFSQFARMPMVNPLQSNINDIIEESIKSYGELPINVELKKDFTETLPQVLIDPDQMRRVFFNIIKNAIEAMQDGGNLSITTRQIEGYIEIEFSDTGTGIPEELMKNLFTPHFSTKRGGAGLGLAIVKKIITDHGGDISVKSKEGEGTTFTIKIPIQQGEYIER